MTTSETDRAALLRENHDAEWGMPVTAWALMLAVGMQDPHAVGSPRRGASGRWAGRDRVGGASVVPDVADGRPYAPSGSAPGTNG